MSTSRGEIGYRFEQNVVMFATCRIVCRGARQSRAESPVPAEQPSFAQALDRAENEPKLRHLTCPLERYGKCEKEQIAMARGERKNWRELCKAALGAQDPDELLKILQELNQALKSEEQVRRDFREALGTTSPQ
jgi:hypothetical protein